MDVKAKQYIFTLCVWSIFLSGCGGGDALVVTELGSIRLDQDSYFEIDLNPDEPKEASYEYKITTQPKYGTLSIGRNSRHWVYTPFKNYYGRDNFSYKVSNGSTSKSVDVGIVVSDVFIKGRPMTVKFLELNSPVAGALSLSWFNSFDIDGNEADILYHVYLSKESGFYPNASTLIKSVVGEVSTTIEGLVEGETYYVAILAEDVDGKLSKDIDRQEINLVTNQLEFQDGIDLVQIKDLPVSFESLTETELRIDLISPIENLSGKTLQLGEDYDFAFLSVGNPVSISRDSHVYSYKYVEPKDLIESISFVLKRAAYDPESALIKYYQDTEGDLGALDAGELTASAAVLEDISDDLLEWAGIGSFDQLYEYFENFGSINLDNYKSDNFECGEFSPDFEPLSPWTPDPLEFSIAVSFECNAAYTVQVKWQDVTKRPELLYAAIDGSIETSISTSGAITGKFLDQAVGLPRKSQLVKTGVIRLWAVPIPYVMALSAQGRFEGEGYGELSADFGTVVSTEFKYGAKYTPNLGFESVGEGFSLQNTMPATTKDFIKNIDVSAKAGVEFKSGVGPKFILSLFNTRPMYKQGKDGLVKFSTDVAPGISFKMETSENPDVVVDKLGAPPFGIGYYRWDGVISALSTLDVPYVDSLVKTVSTNVLRVPFFHLPNYNIEYENLGSNRFSVEATKEEFFTWNDAELVEGQSNWYIIDEEDGEVATSQISPVNAVGKWNDNYSGDSYIVFEYVPDTLASMVVGLSELAQSVSKQYEVYSVKFLLEGEWNVESEIYWEYKPFFLSPMCFLDGPGSIQASWTFNYDAAAKTYARTITSQNGNMNLGLGPMAYMMSFPKWTSVPAVKWYRCYPYDDDGGLFNVSSSDGAKVMFVDVEDRYMSSQEFDGILINSMASLVGASVSDVDAAFSVIDADILSPDKFTLTYELPNSTDPSRFNGSLIFDFWVRMVFVRAQEE